MVNYQCNKCLRIFKQKSHLDDHNIKKKKACIDKKVLKNTNNNIKSEKITENPEKITENTEIFSENPQKFGKIIKNITINDSKLQCKYCNKFFTRKDNLQIHINKYCKNKKHFENLDTIKSKINNNDNKYSKLIEDNIKLIKMLEAYENILKENNLLKNTIPSIINNTNNANNSNNTDNTNNGAINNGIVNSGSINSGNIINIVQFGKEDISKCNLIEMMNIYLKSTGGNIFSNILKYLNFNPKYPENFNILMSDLARENVKIHNGKKFVTKKFKTVKNDILNVLSGHINNMCDNYIEDPKITKNDNILSKIKINDISVKLINDDDITPLLKDNKNEEDNDNDID